MNQAIIVLIIMVVMIVTFFTGWIPIVAAAMGVPLLLELTGILTFSEAWAGFSNSTVISFIPIFTMAAVLTKSSFIYRLKLWVKNLQKGKNGKFKVLAAVVFATFLLTTFMNAASAVAVMAPIIASVAAEAGLSRKQTLKLCGDVSSNSILVLPIGLTLTAYLTYNAYLEAGGAESSYLFGIMDQTILKAPIFVVWLILMIVFGRRFIKVNDSELEDGNESVVKENEKATVLTKELDRLAIGMFFASIVVMVAGTQFFGIPIYLTCGVFAIASIAMKLITVNEAIASMSWVSIVVIAGTLPVATALNKTGASAILADILSRMVGQTNNVYILAAIFFLVPFVLTQFMSNTACAAVFSPLAVTAGVAMGVDPRFLLVASQLGAYSAFLTPMSTACEAITYETGHFKMGEFAVSGIFSSVTWFVLFMIWFPICSRYFF